jgi:hypothetical protein
MPSNENEKPHGWKGEEVERRPGDEAERAAERAEGNEPVRADAEARRLNHPTAAEEGEPDHAAPRQAAAGADDEEEIIEEIAEEHRERLETEGHSPRSKL